MARKSYYGITGVKTREEAEKLLEMSSNLGITERRQLMVGVLVSYRSMRGLSPSDPTQYPRSFEIAAALIDDPRVLNVLHYNSRAGNLCRQLEHLSGISPRVEAVQLNIAWPDITQLERFRTRSFTRVILQLGSRALVEAHEKPHAIVERLRSYEGLIDDVLYDPSGGLGRAFDPGSGARFLEAMVQSGLEMGIGIAGGLSGDTLVARLKPLLEIYPELSFDAQSSLRDPNSCELDVETRCRSFLEATHELLTGE